LLVFGAAILRYAIHEFEEVNWLPPLVAQVWDTSQWLPAGSTLGSILQALVGYTSKPSLLQLIGYVSYLLIMGFLVFGPSRKAHTPAPVPGTASVQDEVIVEKSEPHAVPIEVSGAR
jgi:high-affinity Fe2+/Pb2+ permease